ncbi:MAG: 2-amino-4-hydroxy-6-hydroxymethyldihydropteridine diphosphokinase [Alphaproteobacteria bacterium]
MAASAGSEGSGLILIGVGANLPSRSGPPRATCEAALAALGAAGATPVRCSRWYRSAPVPRSSQPWFVNGVAAVETALDPGALLALLLDVERRFGRQRQRRWEPRTLDLDVLDYRGELRGDPPPELPHPRLHERAFVLVPLAEVAPGWRHPRLGRSVEALIAELPSGQEVEALPA